MFAAITVGGKRQEKYWRRTNKFSAKVMLAFTSSLMDRVSRKSIITSLGSSEGCRAPEAGERMWHG